MNNTTRLSGEERKLCILSAVKKIFARKGFEGATTKELATEAGVSEALLYKHYPSKDALYRAMLSSCYNKFLDEMEKVVGLEPSLSTLVSLVHFHVSSLLCSRNPDRELLVRLYFRSMTEDGEFARVALKEKHGPGTYTAKLEECIQAAIHSGDIEDSTVLPRMRALFAERLAFDLMTTLLPATPILDYKLSREQLIEQAVSFILRGIGLKEQVIRKHYNAKALTLLAS